MNTIAFINPKHNEKLRKALQRDMPTCDCGYANGYVAVPPEHPYYGKDYDDVPVEVHGGLTYGTVAGCSAVLDGAEFLEGDHIPENWTVFGFDTCHYDDSLASWPRERCIEETLKLQRRIEVCHRIP